MIHKIFTIISTIVAIGALLLAMENFKIQNTPRLTAKSIGRVYAGPIQNRIDEVITVPITVFNNSDAFAYDVVLDLLFSDGTGREVSLNDYFKSVRLPITRKERMKKGEPWSLNFAPSAPNNAKDIYLAGEKKFKIKLQLEWKDAKGRKYKFVELAELTPSESIEGVSPQFWFESKGSYNSIDDPEEIDNSWGMNFNF